MSVNDYIQVLEKEYGENKSTTIVKKHVGPASMDSMSKAIAKKLGVYKDQSPFWSEKSDIKWTFIDRIRMVTSGYDFKRFKWLDFKTYYSPTKSYLIVLEEKPKVDADKYIKVSYFTRLKKLFKIMWHDFIRVPEPYNTFLKNKNRIRYFSDNITKYFFGDSQERKETELSLKDFGYIVREDHVYFDHNPNQRRIDENNPIVNG
jgi:hypothetical protein